MRYFTGIGSREAPVSLKPTIKEIVCSLNELGYVLRSGGADGADAFFEEHAKEKEIFLPWKGFNGNESELYNISKEALEIAAKYHPVWHNLNQAVKKIMARNVYQVLGYDLNTPSEFVVCWTPDGKLKGGTSQAMKIAMDRNIPIYNLYFNLDRENLFEMIKTKKE